MYQALVDWPFVCRCIVWPLLPREMNWEAFVLCLDCALPPVLPLTDGLPVGSRHLVQFGLDEFHLF